MKQKIIWKIIYFILVFSCALSCFAESQSYGPRQFWLMDELTDSAVLDSTERLHDFEQYDFSGVWAENQDAMLGFVGNNYQRFFIHFNHIQKSKIAPNIYLISGKTKVQNNVSDFRGEITVLHIYEMSGAAKKIARHVSAEVPFKWNKFVLIAKYHFYEKRDQYSGVFTGSLMSFFYFENNKIFYDDLELGETDGYANNLFTGTWKDYRSGVVKKCNFGNFRIPDSGDLDVGAGYFFPDSKYSDKGWKSYVKAYGEYPQSKLALMEEEKAWW